MFSDTYVSAIQIKKIEPSVESYADALAGHLAQLLLFDIADISLETTSKELLPYF